MLNNIKAAIFDLDGTLVNSMWVWDKINDDMFKELNMEKPKNFRQEINHLSFKETAIYFKNKYSPNSTVEGLMKSWNDNSYNYYANEVLLKDGAKEFLEKLKENNIKIGLATSNSTTLLEATLKNNDIYNLFDAITTTGEVSRGKNFPDVYLLAAEKLSVNPCECIVFEDILAAAQGAKAAGMKVIAVHDNNEDEEELRKFADKYINDFNELLL